ncbi:MAG: dTDP-4-dehydrorhamnose reductase [Lutibacter sp.]
MENILVTGAQGQLGNSIQAISQEFPKYQILFKDRKSLDITNKELVKNFIKKNNISTIVNAAAFTQVDLAEDEADKANLINAFGTKNLAEIAKELNVKLIHISTDYVFNGKKNFPYVERDETNPESIYGKSKLSGEQAIKKVNPAGSVIIRTSWLYSEFGSNFVKTILKLSFEKDEIKVVHDQVGSPTYAIDLAEFIMKIIPKIKNKDTEIYHFSNIGYCSWYDLAVKIVEVANSNCKVLPIPSSQFPTKAIRPKYSVLNTNKAFQTFGIKNRNWKEGLNQCLNKLLNS